MPKSEKLENRYETRSEAMTIASEGGYEKGRQAYLQFLGDYPSSEYAPSALAWAMGCSRSLGTLDTEIALLETFMKHENEKVRDQATLWLLSSYSKAGDRHSASDLVDTARPSVLDREMKLNWANELLNEFGDQNAAEEVFDQLLSEYPDGVTEEAIQVIRSTARMPEEVHLPKPSSKSSFAAIPQNFSVSQNYPNPFNPETAIRYDLPQNSHALLRIYNLLGQPVRTLVDNKMSAGQHTIHRNGKDEMGDDVSGGVYFCRMQAGEFQRCIKLLLVR